MFGVKIRLDISSMLTADLAFRWLYWMRLTHFSMYLCPLVFNKIGHFQRRCPAWSGRQDILTNILVWTDITLDMLPSDVRYAYVHTLDRLIYGRGYELRQGQDGMYLRLYSHSILIVRASPSLRPSLDARQ